MNRNLVFLFVWLYVFIGNAQEPVSTKIKNKEEEIERLKAELDSKKKELEVLKFEDIQERLVNIGLPVGGPEGQLVKHKAMVLHYVEKYEQASWVYHIILPEVKNGNFSRSNDFRTDSLVSTGTAIEKDYFLKTLKKGGGYTYDGFGYDRGHLAPSADFRWSKEALSESYFYSNMSPQYPEFNRGIWAELEGSLRGYVIRTGHPLYVVTGGILRDELPVVERSVNKVAIPQKFFKVAYDPESNICIGFLIPNIKGSYESWRSYAVTVDKVEEATGIDFFPKLKDESVESQVVVDDWSPVSEQGNVEPIPADQLPKNTFNTLQARYYADKGKAVRICGKVVSTHKSGKGNVFLNLDRKFPNQVFSVSVWKSDLVNFSYEPHIKLINELVCVTGKISDYKGVPSMNVQKEEAIEVNPEL